jgi:hypothetical protein
VGDLAGDAQHGDRFRQALTRDVLIGHVHHDADATDRCAGRIDLEVPARIHPAHHAVGPADAILGLEDWVGQRHAGVRSIVVNDVVRENKGMELLEGPGEFGGRDPKPPAGRIGPGQPAGAQVEAPASHASDALRVVEQRRLLAQRLLVVFAIGDIDEHVDRAGPPA